MRGSGTDEHARSLLAGVAASEDSELDALVAGVSGASAPASGPTTGRWRRRPADSDEGRVFMKGELQPGLSSDLIQLFAQNRETGRLAIEWQGGHAALYLADGQIVDARCGSDVGERAFFHFMRIHEGRFTYQRGVTTASVRIFRKTQHLIMDTLRLIDEGGAPDAADPQAAGELTVEGGST